MKDARLRKGLSQTDVARQAGISLRMYQRFEDGLFPKFRSESLQKIDEILGTNVYDNIYEKTGSYLEKRLSIKNVESGKISVMDIGSRAGIVTVFGDNGNGGVPVGELPRSMFPGCDHAEVVRGDSMHPVVRNGSTVVGRIFEKSLIVNGDIYLIHTTNGLHTIKYVHNVRPGIVLLKSYNKEIPDQEISIDEIRMICRVLFIVNPA